MTDLRKAAEQALEKIAMAHAKIDALCLGNERWTMSVPARPDHDHDLVISGALYAAAEVLRAALAQPDVPEGYVLVPVEPTDEMVDAACAAVDDLYRVDFVRAYEAAIAQQKGGA